jgi:peptidyl-prolyl cis-trans isomerase D
MLNVLRSSIKETPYLKWVLIVVGLGMVAYLGNYFVGNRSAGGRSDWVARVNGVPISQWRFREVARNLDDYYRNLFGANYEDIKPQLQISRQAVAALVETELILQDARRLGLRNSAADLAAKIHSYPGLQDQSGRFIGKERYKRVLERNYPGGYTAFERTLGEDLLESQWTALVTQAVVVSDGELREIFRKRTEKTEIDYVVVASADQTIDNDPGEDELRRWYDDHVDTYMRDAGRNIRYVVIDRESLLDTIEVSDDDVRAYYDANQTTYTHPEQRRARHILFRLESGASDEDKQRARQRAEEALERLRNGADFAALAEELSDDAVTAKRGGDLDFFGRDQMVEPFAEAVFSTPVGEYAPITETPYGIHVIEVTDSRPAGVRPLADVADDIRQLLRFRRADDRVTAEAQRLRDEIGSADRLDEVAAREGLSVESAFFNKDEQPPGLSPSAEFADVVASLEPGALSTPVRVGAGMALVVVDEDVPASPAPFEEVRSRVTSALLDERRRAAALEAARAANDGHADFDSVAKALGQEVHHSGELAPGQAPPEAGGSTPELTEILFGDSAAEGDRGVIAVPDGAMVYRISGRTPFDPQRFATEKSGLRREIVQNRRAQHRQAIIEQMKTRQQIEYNASWLDTIEG